MMRKFNKKKSSRRGAILVTVVFVLAFATIFIAAAMTLTQATRKRVYQEAYSDQARLTVTSVAEAWYRAVNMCEFDDASILSLCKGSGTTIHVVAPSAADRIPGMEVDGTTDANNCTTVFFHRDHTGSGTKDDQYTYYADFTTNIGGRTENVRSVLTYTLPDPVEGGKPFSAQVDLNTEVAQNNFTDFGKGMEGKAKDSDEYLNNIFLARKGGKNNAGGMNIYSTMVYCDGAVSFKAEKFYSEDMVFLTGAYFQEKSDSTQPDHMDVKNFFFFGKSDEPISAGDSTHWKANSSQTFYLCKRSNSGNWSGGTGGAKIVYVNADGTKVGDPEGESSLPTNIQKKIRHYAAYNTQYAAGGTDNYPTTSQFLKSASKLGIHKTHPSTGVTTTSLGAFLTSQCYQAKEDFADPGVYYFSSDGSHNTGEKHPGITGSKHPGEFEAKEPYIVVLNGSADYKFYFAGTSFYLRNVIFIVNKPNTGHPVVFVLENGAEIYWAGDPNSPGTGYKTSDVKVGGNGIISTCSRNYDTAEAAYKFVKGEFDQQKGENAPRWFDHDNYSSSRGWSSYYDGVNEVSAYVIGMGNNKFSIDKCMVIEGFIGLFNEDYTNNHSEFNARNSKDSILYGRIMTDGYDDNTSGGGIAMPASPGSSNVDAVDPGFKKLVTNFTLVKMVYYYNLNSNKTSNTSVKTGS